MPTLAVGGVDTAENGLPTDRERIGLFCPPIVFSGSAQLAALLSPSAPSVVSRGALPLSSVLEGRKDFTVVHLKFKFS